MSSAEGRLALPRRYALAAVGAVLAASPRVLVYCVCTVLALLVAHHLGKEMAWDTLDYHLYAGLSALHDRFAQDYFAAGPQAYFNPYVFVPFYLLVNSGLTALEVSLILALVQSAILWLTYELALAVAPADRPRVRLGLALCAVLLAFANPILLDQLGTSFSDVLTAEVVLLGWLLLVRAIRTPKAALIVWAGLVLGCASALKLTNAVHCVAAGFLVLFLPVSWRDRFRHAVILVLTMAAGFVIISAPWSIRLEEHFGNPLFPLMNGVFRSPDFSTAHMVDYRFIPVSLGAALWLPFALIAPQGMVDVEWFAPDMRYALLLVAAVAALVIWVWKRTRPKADQPSLPAADSAARIRAALGCAFAADWIAWLAASGNGRYFIPMACVAAVLGIGLVFRLCANYPKLRNYLLIALFAVQLYQLHVGTEYPARLSWASAPWFQVEMPQRLVSEPALYFVLGSQTDSFLADYLAPGSGLVNLEGTYTLGPSGANGKHIRSLIQRYSPHLQVLVRDIRREAGRGAAFGDADNTNDALEPFGLRVDTSRCEQILVRGMPPLPVILVDDRTSGKKPPPPSDAAYFFSCQLVPGQLRDPGLIPSERSAELAFDHLEDACPALLQPARPASYLRTDKKYGYTWVRRYTNTDMAAWTKGGWLYFQRLIGGGQQGVAGRESVWDKASLPVTCGRGGSGYFLRVLGSR